MPVVGCTPPPVPDSPCVHSSYLICVTDGYALTVARRSIPINTTGLDAGGTSGLEAR